MKSHVEYLRGKVLWDHLQSVSNTGSDVEEILNGLTFASAISLLDAPEDLNTEFTSSGSLGGVTTSDLARYGQRRGKLSQNAMMGLSESLDRTLHNVTLYFLADQAEELDKDKLRSLCKSLPDDVLAEVKGKEKDAQELLSCLDIILDLYQEATELYPCLRATLHETMETLPVASNAKDTTSHDLLAMTIEASLLKLSLVRARLRNSLYNYTSPSTPGVTMLNAVTQLHEKLLTRERALEAQEWDVRSRLNEYEQMLELVDGKGGGFAQVVEDLATVKRETEECCKDLRRLGWTEN